MTAHSDVTLKDGKIDWIAKTKHNKAQNVYIILEHNVTVYVSIFSVYFECH